MFQKKEATIKACFRRRLYVTITQVTGEGRCDAHLKVWERLATRVSECGYPGEVLSLIHISEPTRRA